MKKKIMSNDRLIIQGGKPLFGDVKISGAKNAVLPLISISLLFNKGFSLQNVPDLADTRLMIKLINALGVMTKFYDGVIDFYGEPQNIEAPKELVSKMRASILVLAPLLSKRHNALIPMPGGCEIGERPINYHIDALKQLGAETYFQNGFLRATLPHRKFIGNEIKFPQISVGATECAIMGATLAIGKTKIYNAAKEPEIVDLGNCLNLAGAKIKGLGTNIIEIEGVSQLDPIRYSVIPDRIEAGSFAIIAGITKGEVNLLNSNPNDLKVFFQKLKQTNVNVEVYNNTVKVTGVSQINSVNIQTEPHPGFPTDLQAQFMSLMCIANGKSVIEENIFENRFMHVPELSKMNASLKIDGNKTIVNGVKQLQGAAVKATDLRASMSLIAASLNANGESVVNDLSHLKRGYENFEEKLFNIGANIR